MSADISFRMAEYGRPSEALAICDLYRRVFGVNMEDGLGFWYAENPAGGPYGIVACDGDKVVGHFGTMSIRAMVEGASAKGRLSMGFMVDPEYRGRSIAAGLSDALFSDLRGLGEGGFVIGFPNDVSYRMHVERMGYEPLRDFSFVTLPRDPSASAAYNREAEPACGHNSIVHDEAFLAWRYADPKYEKRLAEDGSLYVCTRFADKMDILYWTPGAPKEAVLSFAARLYERDGVTRVCTWNTYGWLNQYPRDERRYHMTLRPLTDDANGRDSLMRDWIFYMGDCELF
jgi:predicted N-acetyltransferase YhbS